MRAGLVERPAAWRWSSARPHLAGAAHGCPEAAALLAEVGDWHAFLATAAEATMLETLRQHGRTGRPLGNAAFVAELEHVLGRRLTPGKRGPKPRNSVSERRNEAGAVTSRTPDRNRIS
ncbi:MAG: hypothetical protein U1E14_07795 [Geminicoccaceae bacterium]